MKKSLKKVTLFLIILFIFVNSVSAWDDTGHKLIAYIAWQQMTPTAREKAVKILLNAPEDSDLSVYYLQDSRSAAAKGRELFLIASTWADIVRDKKFKERFAKYHHGNWHYLDTFWREVDGKVELVTDLKSDQENAIERLHFFDRVLRDNSVSDEDKAIALAWILHLVGDIHQPLHDSARVTQDAPKGDQGGNLFLLSPKDAKPEESLNLHWYWDSIIGRNIPRVNDACDSGYIPAIADKIMEKYPYSKMQSRLNPGNFDEWRDEGYKIASTKLYPESLKPNQMPSESYKKQAFEIAQEQIALAGYRLGNLLNQIFENQNKANFEMNKSIFETAAKERGSNIGKGKDDLRLWTKINSALAAEDTLRESIINTDVDNNVVTLRGMVHNNKQMQMAVKIVNEIEGVKAIKNQLEISH